MVLNKFLQKVAWDCSAVTVFTAAWVLSTRMRAGEPPRWPRNRDWFFVNIILVFVGIFEHQPRDGGICNIFGPLDTRPCRSWVKPRGRRIAPGCREKQNHEIWLLLKRSTNEHILKSCNFPTATGQLCGSNIATTKSNNKSQKHIILIVINKNTINNKTLDKNTGEQKHLKCTIHNGKTLKLKWKCDGARMRRGIADLKRNARVFGGLV